MNELYIILCNDTCFIIFNFIIYSFGAFVYIQSRKSTGARNNENGVLSLNSNEKAVELYELPTCGIDNNLKREIFTCLLKNALEIRKFEIERYWQRSLYFWGFIAACFTAYCVTIYHDIFFVSYLVTVLGLFASFAFSLILKGCKFWQINWERHVDILESSVYGSLYKTVLFTSSMSPSIISSKPWPVSVSKVNQHLANIILAFWIILFLISQGSIAIRAYSHSWTSICLNIDYICSMLGLFAACRYAGYMEKDSVTGDFAGYKTSDFVDKSFYRRKCWWK